MASTWKNRQPGVPVSRAGPACSCQQSGRSGARPSASSAGFLPLTGLPHLCQHLEGPGEVRGGHPGGREVGYPVSKGLWAPFLPYPTCS